MLIFLVRYLYISVITEEITFSFLVLYELRNVLIKSIGLKFYFVNKLIISDSPSYITMYQ